MDLTVNIDIAEKSVTGYISTLPSDVKTRYVNKIAVIGCDPYTITIDPKQFGRDRMAWPAVSYIDIFNYLVCSTSWYTKEEMKHYKSLEGYKLAQDDWIRDMLHTEINGYHLILAKVTHSMRIAEKPLEPWVIICADGSVESAHCTCMAGLAEACSHVGAILFALEICSRVRSEATPTDLPAYWIVPSSTRLETQFKKLKDMDMKSASKKRKLQLGNLSIDHVEDQDVITQPAVCSPTAQEENIFFETLHKIQPNACILAVTDSYAENHQPATIKVGLPPNLGKLYNPELSIHDKSAIATACQSVDLNFTQDQADILERQTQAQRKSKLWAAMRVGRITASTFKSACKTDVDKPSLDLLKRITTPATQNSRQTEAMKWGISNEKIAREAYKKIASKEHEQFILKESGLCLNPQYPAFGASPDGIVCCSCCGKGCLEIKCPYILADESKSLKDIEWLQFNENDKPVGINKKHEHYFQIQCQMFLTESHYCDLTVWSPFLPLLVIRMYPDHAFWSEMSEKAITFHVTCVIPELCTKLYTLMKQSQATQQSSSSSTNSFCICHQPDDGRRMIMCDNNICALKWFHVECLKIKRIPKGKWFCSACKPSKNKK